MIASLGTECSCSEVVGLRLQRFYAVGYCIAELFHIHHQWLCQIGNKGRVRWVRAGDWHDASGYASPGLELAASLARQIRLTGVQKFRRKDNGFVDYNEYRTAFVRSFMNPKWGARDRLTVATSNLYAL